MNFLYKTLNAQQTYQIKVIVGRIRQSIKALNQHIQNSYISCRNCRIKTIWDQLNNEFIQIQAATKTFSNYHTFTMEDVKIFYQNGNRQLSKIQSIATQMLIELSEKKKSTTIVRTAANQAEAYIDAVLKELQKIVVQFNIISHSFMSKLPNITQTPTLNNLDNSFNKKQNDKKFQALIAERQQNLKKTHKQRENKIREQEAKQRELLTQQILKYQNENKMKNQRIKTLEETILRQRTQQDNFNEERKRLAQVTQTQKQQNEELKRRLKTQEQKILKLQQEKRLRIQGQQPKLKIDSQIQQKQLKPLQQKLNISKQQLSKLQEQTNRIKTILQSTKKQDYKCKQSIEMGNYELKDKIQELQNVKGEVLKMNKFIEVKVNERLMKMIEQLNQVTGDNRINMLNGSMNGVRKNNNSLANTQPTRNLQQNLLNLLSNFQPLITHLKHQFTHIQDKISSNTQDLTSLQEKLSSSSNIVSIQRQQYHTRQKQLKQLEKKYQILTSYEALLDANKQQSRIYEQINHKIQERQKIYQNEKQKIQSLNQQYNTFLKERFRDACNIQELHSRIEQLTKEKNHISQTVEKKYHHQISSENNQKLIQVQKLADLLQRKEFELTQLLNQDKKNKTEISKLTKELQDVKRSHETEKQRMIEKLNQYEFKVNRLLEEKQQFLLKLNHSSGDTVKTKENYQNEAKQSRDQLQKVRKKQPQIFFTPTHNSRISSSKLKNSSQQVSSKGQKVQKLIEQNESLQDKIKQLNSQLTQIKQQIHKLNKHLSQSSSKISEKEKETIEELQCQYEEKQQMISFCQEEINKNKTQILKLKKSLHSTS